MKINCLFVYIFIFLIIGSTSFAADNKFANARDAKQAARESTVYRTEVCNRIIRNFYKDRAFVRGLSFYCMYVDTFQTNFTHSVYPLSNNDYKGYKDIYPYVSSNFIIETNADQIKMFKRIVQDYCEYNSAYVKKKDPEVCSPERINSLFKK